jgi:hypothetical protein
MLKIWINKIKRKCIKLIKKKELNNEKRKKYGGWKGLIGRIE